MKNDLIVDDGYDFIDSVVYGLKKYADEFNVHSAFGGKAAIEILNSKSIDLVVTDLKMPEIDGFSLLSYMSKNHPSVAVVVMTAYANEDIKK